MIFRYLVIVGCIALFSFILIAISLGRYEMYDHLVRPGHTTDDFDYGAAEQRLRLWSIVFYLSFSSFVASPIIAAPIYYYFVRKRSKISNE